MRVIIAGSRSIVSKFVVHQAIQRSEFDITEVVCGLAKGPDLTGKEWAEACDIPVNGFRPDWKKHGQSAGYKRNLLMAQNADALIAIWDGKSKGTKHMIDIARKQGLKVFICKVTGDTFKRPEDERQY